MSQTNIEGMGKHIKKLAKLRREPLGDTAYKVGVSRSTLFEHLNGSSRPSVDNLVGYIHWAWDPEMRQPFKSRFQRLPDDEADNALRATLYGLTGLANGEIR